MMKNSYNIKKKRYKLVEDFLKGFVSFSSKYHRKFIEYFYRRENFLPPVDIFNGEFDIFLFLSYSLKGRYDVNAYMPIFDKYKNYFQDDFFEIYNFLIFFGNIPVDEIERYMNNFIEKIMLIKSRYHVLFFSGILHNLIKFCNITPRNILEKFIDPFVLYFFKLTFPKGTEYNSQNLVGYVIDDLKITGENVNEFFSPIMRNYFSGYFKFILLCDVDDDIKNLFFNLKGDYNALKLMKFFIRMGKRFNDIRRDIIYDVVNKRDEYIECISILINSFENIYRFMYYPDKSVHDDLVDGLVECFNLKPENVLSIESSLKILRYISLIIKNTDIVNNEIKNFILMDEKEKEIFFNNLKSIFKVI